VQARKALRKRVGFTVDQKIDAALPIQQDVLVGVTLIFVLFVAVANRRAPALSMAH
jgi:hypothetical protein